MTSDLSAFTLRTVATTEHQWIAITATSMTTDAIDSVDRARAENLKSLHSLLAQTPPGVELGGTTTWLEPYHDMKVTIHDTIIRQDLMTGEALSERELSTYDIPYYAMNPEEN